MAGKDSRNGRRGGTTIIKQEEIVEGGHHGGAWKVAYADFVTAMMAFFLLMWLLNATTEAQRRGLADYFTPINAISNNSSGNGQPFGGHTPYDDGRAGLRPWGGERHGGQGAPAAAGRQRRRQRRCRTGPKRPADAGSGSGQGEQARGNATVRVDQTGEHAPRRRCCSPGRRRPPRAPTCWPMPAPVPPPRPPPTSRRARRRRRRNGAAFQQAAQQIRDAVRNDPALADLARQLAIDMTPDGLRIQMLDEDKQPMFATGSAALNERGGLLLHKIAPVLAKLTEPLSIAGHTDAAPYKGNEPHQLGPVVGARQRHAAAADRCRPAGEPVPRSRRQRRPRPAAAGRPMAAVNRRIAIMVLRTARPR